jgi:hypothetical protein
MATTKKSAKKSSKKTAKKSAKKYSSPQQPGVASAGESMVVEHHDVDVLANLIGGCYKIVGSPINLEVCYSFDATKKTVCVTIKLAGNTIGRECLSLSKPSYNICHSLAVVKACVGLSFNASTRCLTFTAKACFYAPFSWHCKSYQGKIACF